MTIDNSGSYEPSVIDWLPDEVVCHIMTYLDGRTLGTVRLVCDRLCRISHEALICDAVVKNTVDHTLTQEVKKLNISFGVESIVSLFFKILHANIPYYSITGKNGVLSSKHIRRLFRELICHTKELDAKCTILNFRIRNSLTKIEDDQVHDFLRLLPMQLIKWTPKEVVNIDKCILAINNILEVDDVLEDELATLHDQLNLKTSFYYKYDAIVTNGSPKLIEHTGHLLPSRTLLMFALLCSDPLKSDQMEGGLLALGGCYGECDPEHIFTSKKCIMMGSIVLGAYFLRRQGKVVPIDMLREWFGEDRHTLDAFRDTAQQFFTMPNHPLIDAMQSKEFDEFWNQFFFD